MNTLVGFLIGVIGSVITLRFMYLLAETASLTSEFWLYLAGVVLTSLGSHLLKD